MLFPAQPVEIQNANHNRENSFSISQQQIKPSTMSPQNNAARPPQPPPPPQHLKISRDSHAIHKSSSSSSSSNSSNNFVAAATSFASNIRLQHHHQQQHSKSPQTSNSNNNYNNQNLHQRHHPVIIYTHSPKVIHITPRDFLSLVQKLTGLARSQGEDAAVQQINSNESPSDANNSKNSNEGKMVGHHDTSPSSVITDENSHNHQVMMMNLSSSISNHHIWDQHLPPTQYIPSSSSDIPIYAPNPDFFCSSKPLYRYHPDSSVLINSSNINGASISPSLLHVIKGTGLPHY